MRPFWTLPERMQDVQTRRRLVAPLINRMDRLQIQIPAALADVMGVTDPVAKLRAAPAHIANSCHGYKYLLKTAKLVF